MEQLEAQHICLVGEWNNPRAFTIIKSGWSDFYHVIEEDPIEGDLWFDHQLLSEKELKNKFPNIKLIKKIKETKIHGKKTTIKSFDTTEVQA